MAATGIARKYTITRTDGSSAPGAKHADCTYFVLDLSCDDFAIPALKAYAKACRKEEPQLADNLLEIVNAEPQRCSCREASCPHSLGRAFSPQTPSEMTEHLISVNERRSR